MLITVAYGTTTYSRWAQYSRAQEIDRTENGFIPLFARLFPIRFMTSRVADQAVSRQLSPSVALASGRLSLGG
ncbi:MAG: hypothetical protein ACLUHE_16245 [Christensenellales bacterium]